MILLRARDVEEDVREGLDRVRISPQHQIRPADVVEERDVAECHAREEAVRRRPLLEVDAGDALEREVVVGEEAVDAAAGRRGKSSRASCRCRRLEEGRRLELALQVRLICDLSARLCKKCSTLWTDHASVSSLSFWRSSSVLFFAFALYWQKTWNW